MRWRSASTSEPMAPSRRSRSGHEAGHARLSPRPRLPPRNLRAGLNSSQNGSHSRCRFPAYLGPDHRRPHPGPRGRGPARGAEQAPQGRHRVRWLPTPPDPHPAPQQHPHQRLTALVPQLHPHLRSTAPGRVTSPFVPFFLRMPSEQRQIQRQGQGSCGGEPRRRRHPTADERGQRGGVEDLAADHAAVSGATMCRRRISSSPGHSAPNAE